MKYKKYLLIISALLFLFFVMAILGQGTFMKENYLDPWNTKYHQNFEDDRIKIIAHAILAPNAHNMQSWKIILDKENKNKFSLFLEDTRLLPQTDIDHRQSIISQGTFLSLVNIASNKLGYEAKILIYPKGELPNSPSVFEIQNIPTAEIELIKSNESENPLYSAIFDRVTTRTDYLEKPLKQEQVDAILKLNNNPDIEVLVFQDSEDLKFLKELAISGVEIESNLEKTMNESSVVMRYSEYQKNKYRYGLTLSSQGFPKFKEFFFESYSSIFGSDMKLESSVWRESETKRIQKTPAYFLIISKDNSRTTQVKVGMLYAEIQLIGTVLSLSMQPTMQITQEYEEMSALYNEVHKKFADNGRTVQMLFRVGEAEKQVKHSPRKDVLDFIFN